MAPILKTAYDLLRADRKSKQRTPFRCSLPLCYLYQIKTIRVHDLDPCGGEVRDKLGF